MSKAPPAFFKVFIAEISDQDLKIPPAFIQRLEEALPHLVHLKDRHNNVWTVKVGKIESCWHFLDGWVKFSRDNFLSSGDILVFEYLREGFFDVLIFGTSATEKNIIPFTPEGVEEKQDHVSEQSIYDSDDDKTEDNTYVMSKGSDSESGEEDEYGDDYDDKEFTLDQANNAIGGSGVTMRHDCYGMEIFQAGLAREPINPFFVAKINQKRKGDLVVPKNFRKDFTIEFGDEITLVDPKNRYFQGKCKKWSDGRVVISGRWKSLCRLNLVAHNDHCICEFLKCDKGRQQLLSISFVRANKIRDL